MTTQYVVEGKRESSGNEFQAPVETDGDEEQAMMDFLAEVEDPSDFTVQNVEKQLA